MFKHLFSPAGRSTRNNFWLSFIAMCVVIFTLNRLMVMVSGSFLAFILSIATIFLLVQMTYSIYGKRLHDFGKSLWPVTGLLFGLLCAALTVMMVYGGADYFSEFSAANNAVLLDPDKEAIDPEIVAAIQEKYQARLAEGVVPLAVTMWGILGVFTLWVGLSKPDPKPNKYGNPVF